MHILNLLFFLIRLHILFFFFLVNQRVSVGGTWPEQKIPRVFFFFFHWATCTHAEKKHSSVWNQMHEAEFVLVIKWRIRKRTRNWVTSCCSRCYNSHVNAFKVVIIRYIELESVWIFSSFCLTTPLTHCCICRPTRCDVDIHLDSHPTSNYVKPHINYHTGSQPKYKEVRAALRCWWMSVFNCHSLKMVSVCDREDSTE